MAIIETLSDGTLYYLTIKGLKENKAHFELVKAGEWEDKKKVQGIEGVYKGIEVEEKEIEVAGKKKKITEVKVHLQDGEEHYIIRGAFTGVMRSLLNKLLNIEKNQVVRITIGTFNEKNYISVYRGKEKIDWKISWEDMKKMIKEVEINGEIVRDYSELNKYLAENNVKFEKDEPVIDEDDEIEFGEESKKEDLPF